MSATPKNPQQNDERRIEAKYYAPTARIKRRHILIIFSFILMVLMPVLAAIWYAQNRTADQYASMLGFSVQQENSATPIDFIGGNFGISNSSTDTDILFEFIQSQIMVRQIQDQLDLKTIYSKPKKDFIFRFDPDGSIEDLVEYWGKMVKIYYDSNTGLIQIRVLAFDPVDANKVATAIVDNSTVMINQLNAASLKDQTGYAKEELGKAVGRMKIARQALTTYRVDNQIVDPNVDLTQQMGLLGTLQQQLTDALIEAEVLVDTTQEDDPRLVKVRRKIDVIERQIADERRKLGISSETGGGFSELVGHFEALKVDVEFAEQSYVNALAAYDTALSDARRKSRYLAAFVQPTLAETSRYPNRLTIVALMALFLFLTWATLVLFIYSIRDRR